MEDGRISEQMALGHAVNAYSIFGVAAAVYLLGGAAYLFRRQGLSVRLFGVASLLSIIGFLLGCRLLFALLHPHHVMAHPALLFELRLNNFALYGGLFTVFLGLKYLFGTRFGCRKSTIKAASDCGTAYFRLTDAISPHLGIAVAIMRLGCFFSGCCYGKPTTLPVGMAFARADAHPLSPLFGNHSILTALFAFEPVLRHPTQLYEIAVALLASLLAWHAKRRFSAPGLATAVFMWVFTCGRLMVFFLREYPADGHVSAFIGGPVFYAGCLIWLTGWIHRLLKS